MSFDAIRWAMDQPVEPALTKFCLVAMAECVNSEGPAMECWPSYAFLAKRTGMNTKTVEASVFRLKQQGYIVDTGKRSGDTGKVIVYRLNATDIGAIQPTVARPGANGTRPRNTPEKGVIGDGSRGHEIPPNPEPNPPKSDDQSPQKVAETTPKTGVGISKGIRKGSKKEAGTAGAALPIDGVPPDLLEDWKAVRKDKRAGPVTATVIAALQREAAMAGISLEHAVRCCAEWGWQGFRADWYAKRIGSGAPESEQKRGETFV